ncbi:MAG: DUF2341 domain-containing protein, partial [Candidatus Roizmanbacteria bacterium]|nr:DUF2341 domain-containing protein [Candidatus Roizmanbacteria bacterium]
MIKAFTKHSPLSKNHLSILRTIFEALLVRKVLLLSLAVLIITLPILYLVIRYQSKVEAAWFNDNWLYRITLTIGNTGAADANKKVKFDIDTATLITAGKLQSDCGDSRFTDINGRVLKYFIDTAGGACNTASTDYYVLVPTIFSGNTVLYHYYGNLSAENGTQSSQFSEATFTPTSGPTGGSEEKSTGPVAYWKFDEGYGTTVNNSTANTTWTGSISGPTWQNEDQCISGKCLYQDGLSNKYTVISSNITSGWAANNDFTINLWFNCKGEGFSAPPYSYLAGLFIHGNSADSGTGGFYLRQASISCANMIFQVSATTVSHSITPNLTSGANKWAMITA